jgi:hypothetical protein
MVTPEEFRKKALSFPAAVELPHFEKTSFRVAKKIFATLSITDNEACVKLSKTDQHIFCSAERGVMYPVPGKWGKHGWTMIDLNRVGKRLANEALVCAYVTVAPKKIPG